MAEQLKTVLGFEASDAIATLNQMATALDGYTSAMRKAAGATRKFNKSAAGVDSKLKALSAATGTYTKSQQQQVLSSKKIQTALTKEKQLLESVRGAVVKTGESTKKASGQMVLSWQSVVRIFAIQVIHQAISKITSSLREGIGEAIDLEIKFAEIQTISQQLSKDFEGVSSSVRALSDEFGVAAGIIAEGTYQTLSNQVAQGAQAFTFLKAAADFGTAAVTDTDSAVNLLSSAINAFGFSASQTATISAKLFKTIELGRIRGEEFANTYGRILVLAADLGVAFDEVNASVATLTISGLRYNEAFTLINNVMLKLIRPTAAMNEEFERMGLVSSEAGIQAFGFQGLLEKLRERAGGTASELGELFGRVRAIRGALGLTGKAAKTYEKNLKAIQEASSKDIGEQKMKIFATNAKQVTIEMQRLKNAIVFDFGRSALATLNVGIKAMGGLVAGSKAAALAVAALAVQVIILAKSFVFNPVIAQLAIVTAAVFAASVAWQKWTETAFEGIQKVRKAEKDAAEARANQESDLAEIRIKGLRTAASAAQKILIERISSFTELRQAAFDSQAEISADFLAHLQNDKGSFEDYVNDIESILEKSASSMKSIQKKIFDLTREGEDIRFDESLTGRSALRKSFAQRKRALSLQERANAATKAGNTEQAQSLTNDAKAAAAKAKQLALSADNRVAFSRARKVEESIRADEIAGLEKAKSLELDKSRAAIKAFDNIKTTIEDLSKEDPIQILAEIVIARPIETIDDAIELSKRLPEAESAAAQQIRDATAQTKAQDEYNSALEFTQNALKDITAELSKAAKIRKVQSIGPLGAPGRTEFIVGRRSFDTRAEAVTAQKQLLAVTDQLIGASKRLDSSFEETFDPQLFESAVTSMEGAAGVLDKIGLDAFSTKLGEARQGAVDAGTAVQEMGLAEVSTAGVDNFLRVLQQIEKQHMKNARAAQASAAASASTQSKAFGGLIYRATGGPVPRGSDRRLAMLTVDEIVMNTKASRRFASQLTAMNAGVEPQFRQSGGAITNIGDVNISVQGAMLPAQTARETMMAFKREMRRSGTSFN